MLKAIDTDLWVAEQPLTYYGLAVGTRMTVIRLHSGEVMVISPIRPTDALQHALNQVGPVRTIVIPNLYHHLFAAEFKQAYPHAELWATADLPQKRPDLRIDRVLGAGADPQARDRPCQLVEGVETIQVKGLKTLDIKGFSPLDEWVFFHAPSRTLIVTDLVFHFDARSSPTARMVSRLIGGYQQLQPSLLEKIATRDKAQVRPSIQHLLTWEFDRVIMAHGSIVEEDGRQRLRTGYEWFLERSL